MSDIFTVTASVVALGASIVAGPVGPIDARPALDLHNSANHGVVAVAYRDGELAGTIGNQSSTAAYGDFPPLFFKALEAAEDSSFPQHMGVDPAGIARAGIDLVRSRLSGGSPDIGGSTLTQQLAKNVVTGSNRSISRKLADMVSAVETESVASKDQILESYANAVYFGRGSHGAKDAAENWFGKDWKDLDLGELAFLAGLVQAPSALDPLVHPEAAKARRDYVLDRMVDEGVITRDKANAAEAGPIDVIKPRRVSVVPQEAMSDSDFWALAFARRQLSRTQQDAASSGEDEAMVLPLESSAQRIAEDDLATGLEKWQAAVGDEPLGSVFDKGLSDLSDPGAVVDAANAVAPRLPKGAVRVVVEKSASGGRALTAAVSDKAADVPDLADVPVPKGAEAGDVYVLMPGKKKLEGRPRVQGAVVAISLSTGQTILSVGGVRSWASQFDRTQAARQPGSSVKPFLYLAALEQGDSPTALISDAPVAMDVDGMDGEDVWSPQNYDNEGTKGYVPLFVGLEKSLNRVAARLIMQIGGAPFRDVLVKAGAYPAADDRLLLPSAALGTIETTPDRMAHAVAALDPQTSNIADPALLEDIQKMMRGVVTRGTAWAAFRNGPDGVVGKTGTSQNERDAWFIGRTGDIAMAIWVGRDDDKPLPKVHGSSPTGGVVAAPIFAQIIRDLRKANLSSTLVDATPFPNDMVAGGYGNQGYGSGWFPPAPNGDQNSDYAGGQRGGGYYGNAAPPGWGGQGRGRSSQVMTGAGLY